MSGSPDWPGARSHARALALSPSDRRQAHGDLRVARRRADQLCRHVEHRVAPILARKPDDHLSGLHDLACAGTSCCNYAWRIRLKLSEAHEIMRDLQLRLGGVDLRLSGLLRLLGLLMVCARGPTLLQQRVLALEVVARLGQLTLRGSQIGLRRAQAVELVLRFEARQDLSRFHA